MKSIGVYENYNIHIYMYVYMYIKLYVSIYVCACVQMCVLKKKIRRLQSPLYL